MVIYVNSGFTLGEDYLNEIRPRMSECEKRYIYIYLWHNKYERYVTRILANAMRLSHRLLFFSLDHRHSEIFPVPSRWYEMITSTEIKETNIVT